MCRKEIYFLVIQWLSNQKMELKGWALVNIFLQCFKSHIFNKFTLNLKRIIFDDFNELISKMYIFHLMYDITCD